MSRAVDEAAGLPPKSGMFRLSPELKAKGDKAEADFRAWLNRSGVAFMYVEQSPLTVPEAMRGRIKRPDYLVGVPRTGTLAFDVKAKTLYEGRLIFDVAELEKQQRFARMFNLTTLLACLDLEQDGHLWWVELTELLARKPEWRGKRQVITMEVNKAYAVNTSELSFLGAVLQYSFRTLDT